MGKEERAMTTATQYEPLTLLTTAPQTRDGKLNHAAAPLTSPGWRATLAGGALACVAVFIINLAVTIWSIFLPYGIDVSESGRRVMYEGSCDTSRRISIVVHLLINILGSISLAASNYGMQCLSAPNRQEVDQAHAKREWLDIGVLSFRNLRKIARKRVALWWLLAISSVPLHLLYNSVVFSSLTTYDYVVYTVDDRFEVPEHLPFFNEEKAQRIEETWGRLRNGELDNLTNIECMNEYSTAFQTSWNHLMLVSEPKDDWDGTSEIFSEELAYLGSSWGQNCPPDVYEWMCPGSTCSQTCRSLLPEVMDNAEDWRPLGYKVKYCLSQPKEQLCRLNFSIWLATAVLAANALKALILAYVVFRPPAEPLFILGDAIQSFMGFPDTASEGSCLASADMIRKGEDWTGSHPLPAKRRYWAAAVSRRRWIFSIAVYCIALGVSLFFLGWGLRALIGPRDITSLWNLGFGAVSETALITGLEFSQETGGLMFSALISNLPQLIFSMLYFQFNGLLTCMTAAREWSDFGVRRKALRVSFNRRGQQRSQYFLQLPYLFSIPLLILSILMHWMLSQSIFIVAIETIRDPYPMFWALMTCGYSPIAIMFVIIASLVMVLSVGMTAFRRLPSNMPVAGSCSLAIAAACQSRGYGQDPDLGLLPLKWGVMESDGGAISLHRLGHCGFSNGHVEQPQVGVSYS